MPLAPSRFASSEVNHSRLVREQAAYRVPAHSEHFRHFRYCPEFLVHSANFTNACVSCRFVYISASRT